MNKSVFDGMGFKLITLVFILGGLGAFCRYCISLVFPNIICTLVVNVLGCFLLAFLFEFVAKKEYFSKDTVGALGTGFIGAFTTFSAFSGENATMIVGREYLLALAYVMVSLLLGLVATIAGVLVSGRLIRLDTK